MSIEENINPLYSPLRVYENFKDQTLIEFPISERIRHPIMSMNVVGEMDHKCRIAQEWQTAKECLNLYDAYVLECGGNDPEFTAFQKYTTEYVYELESKFWS